MRLPTANWESPFNRMIRIGARPSGIYSGLCPDCGESHQQFEFWCQTHKQPTCQTCRYEHHLRCKMWVSEPNRRWLPCVFDYEKAKNQK